MNEQLPTLSTEDDIRLWLEDVFCPTILVRTTDDVEEICKKNNLHFIDLLRPFEKVTKELYTRTTNINDSYPLKNFRVRFRTLDQLERPVRSQKIELDVSKLQPFDKFIGALVHDTYNINDKNIHLPPIINRSSVNLINRGKNYTPWFDEFRKEHLLSIRASDHETFEHPVAVVCVVSTSNPDPIAAFQSLYQIHNPPPIFKEKAMDTDIYQFYILLNDTDAKIDNYSSNNIFGKMKELFGASSCRLLTINSRPIDSTEPPLQDIWSSSMPKFDLYQRDRSIPFGTRLTKADVDYIGIAVDHLITNGVIPQMERKIRHILTTIVNNRGFKKTFYNLFSSKKRVIRSDSIVSEEMEIRKLADYAFMLHDYDCALTHYKMIASDFKNKKEMKRYASVQEFIGLCTLITNRSNKREIDSALQNAFKTYRSQKASMHALRVAIFEGILYKIRGDFQNAAEIFTRAASIEDIDFLTAAILYEQAAFSCLYMKPSQFRKFALFLVLAGYRYSHTRQINHSFRCYVTASKVYENRNWSQIDEHMSITMARLTNFVGDLEASVNHIHDFMSKCNQLPERQQEFMSEFLRTVKSYLLSGTKNDEFDFLSLPQIDVTNVRVLSHNYGTYTYTHLSPDEKWRKMEESLVKAMGHKFYTFRWDSNYRKKLEKCVVGEEPVLVEIEIRNPLHIMLEITNMRLTATFKPKQEAENKEENVDTEDFAAEPLDFILPPNSTRTIQLRICSLKEGELHIEGVKWVIAGVVKGYKKFKLPGKRLNDTKQQRCSVVYEEDTRLKLQTVSGLPLLKIRFQDVPNTLWHGQITKILVNIKNVGKMTAKNIALKMSHPKSVVVMKENESLDELPTDSSNITTGTPDKALTENLSIVRIPLNRPLEPGKSITVPFVFRGAAIGEERLRLLFYYEPEVPNKAIQFRLFKIEYKIKVEESIQMKIFAQPSFQKPNEFTLGLHIKNRRNVDQIDLKQLTSVSPMWKITPLDFNEDELDKFHIPPQESTTLYFNISKYEKNEDENNEESKDIPNLIHTTYPILTKNIRDTRKAPYMEFLFRDCLLEDGLTPFRSEEQRRIDNRTVLTTAVPKKNDLPDYPFFESHGLSLIVFWQSGETIAQSHIRKVRFLPERLYPQTPHLASQFPGKSNLHCPLSVSLIFEKNIKHDFKVGSCCIVPVIFKITNCSSDLTCNFTLGLLPPREIVSTPYLWNGTTKIAFNDIKPSQTVTVPASVYFFAPGKYNLNHFRIKYSTNGNVNGILTFEELQYLITINV